MIILGVMLLNKSTIQSSVENKDSKHRYAINAPSVEDSELSRKKYIFKSISLLGIIFTLALGALAYLNGDHKLTLILFISAFVVVINYLLMVKHIISYRLASDFIVYPLLLLMIYLVASGGIDNLGGLWIYALPMIVLFLHGYKIWKPRSIRGL